VGLTGGSDNESFQDEILHYVQNDKCEEPPLSVNINKRCRRISPAGVLGVSPILFKIPHSWGIQGVDKLTSHEINIDIKAPYRNRLAKKWLREVVATTLSTQKINRPVELSLIVTGDEEVHRLNRNYRGIDKTTDVISFALSENVADTKFVTPPDKISRLGEVIISYPQAAAQAKENKQTIKAELAWLVVHGLLHLLGYDHQDDKSEAIMRKREDVILRGIDL
jgi:probable rRNA maturation factor